MFVRRSRCRNRSAMETESTARPMTGYPGDSQRRAAENSQIQNRTRILNVFQILLQLELHALQVDVGRQTYLGQAGNSWQDGQAIQVVGDADGQLLHELRPFGSGS